MLVPTFGAEELLSCRVLSRSFISNTDANSLLPSLLLVLNENVFKWLLQGKNHPWLKSGGQGVLERWRGGEIFSFRPVWATKQEPASKGKHNKITTTTTAKGKQAEAVAHWKRTCLAVFEAMGSILSISTKKSRNIQDIEGNKGTLIFG